VAGNEWQETGQKRRHQSRCAGSSGKPQSVIVARPAFSSQKFEKGGAADLLYFRGSRPAENEGLEKIEGKNVKPTLQDGPGSAFLSDPLFRHPAFLAIEGCLGNSPCSSINPKTQQKSDFVNANRRSVRDDDRRIGQ
jgi:hypothetical protein